MNYDRNVESRTRMYNIYTYLYACRLRFDIRSQQRHLLRIPSGKSVLLHSQTCVTTTDALRPFPYLKKMHAASIEQSLSLHHYTLKLATQ